MFEPLPIRPGLFLFPARGVDLSKFAVIACDQYTAQPEKWAEMEAFVGDAPSALRMILPECWLGEAETRIPAIHRAMAEALDKGVLDGLPCLCMVLVERETSHGPRLGLLATVDLEAYSYAPGAKTLIRPTEGTVVERIPPRLKVRRDAPLELSHILMLLNDPQRSVIEPLYALRDQLMHQLYDVELMAGGGHLRGWLVGEPQMNHALSTLWQIMDHLEPDGILLAVGDGNHSLATARAAWEELKPGLTPAERETHPARFATVEINNLYDPALVFEPIHRLVFGRSAEETLSLLAPAAPVPAEGDGWDFRLVSPGGETAWRFTRPLHPLPVGTVQQLLDAAQARVDYIHGADTLRGLVRAENTGLLLPAMDKAQLFPAVEAGGPLPRKTFSMGEANEKRYYLEARRITR